MEDSIPERYENNPMLAVLENYVLCAIGELEAGKAETLGSVVCRTFGGTDWKATVRRQFDLPGDTDEQLRRMWKQAREEAEMMQRDLSAEQFAREAADGLFRDLGDQD